MTKLEAALLAISTGFAIAVGVASFPAAAFVTGCFVDSVINDAYGDCSLDTLLLLNSSSYMGIVLGAMTLLWVYWHFSRRVAIESDLAVICYSLSLLLIVALPAFYAIAGGIPFEPGSRSSIVVVMITTSVPLALCLLTIALGLVALRRSEDVLEATGRRLAEFGVGISTLLMIPIMFFGMSALASFNFGEFYIGIIFSLFY